MNFLKGLLNIPGWHTNRKIIVFESDDWGAIRMPSKKGYGRLMKKGIPVDKSFYNKYDALESNEDLYALFEVLNKYRDKNNKPPVFTALSIVANPDFEKIAKRNFEDYFYEPVTKTLEKYGDSHDKVHSLWHQGIAQGIFYPEFHGREHFHVQRWMVYLRKHDKYKICFDHHFFGIRPNELGINEKNHLPAFDLTEMDEVDEQKLIIEEGVRNFKEIFGYSPTLFVPPNGIVHKAIEQHSYTLGIHYLYGAKRQLQPNGKGGFENRFRFTGKKNSIGQVFIGRNVQFEPAKTGSENEWSTAIKEIEHAFLWKKPAVISTHRVNYIGYIDENNRKKGLKQLDSLLAEIIRKWPEVEFMTSRQLGNLMISKNT